MSTPHETTEARRERLVARAAAQRQNLSRQLAPLGSFNRGLERLGSMKSRLPAVAIGVGLGLTALLLVLPGARPNVFRGGLALFHLAGSVKRLFADRRAA